jgi:protein phosphatase
MFELQAAGSTDQGCIRSRNEDRILVDTERGLFIIADGMGGERCGDIAAEVAVRAVDEYLVQAQESEEPWPFGYDSSLTETQNRIVNVVRLANHKVWEASRQIQDCEGMGSTLSVLMVAGDVATIGNVGDSRVYVCRNMCLQQLTRDDAIVSNLIDAGEITIEEAKTHPLRNVLTLTIGHEEDIAVHLIEFTLRSGDRVLLCSDGLHGPVDEAEIEQVIQTRLNPRETVEALVASALQQGGPDNVSCIVVLVSERKVLAPPSDSRASTGFL